MEVLEKPIKLHFDADSHTYSNADTGETFTSVTTVISKYEEDFDTRYWSMYTGLKNANIGVKFEKQNESKGVINIKGVRMKVSTLYNNSLYAELALQTRSTWKKETKKSHIRGNKIHDYLEDTINLSRGDKKAKDNENIRPLNKSTELTIFKCQHDLDQTDLEEVYPEIYAVLLKFIDQGCYLIAEKKIYTSKYMIAGMIDVLVLHAPSKTFAIVDWKSNKDEMMFISGYYPKVKTNEGYVKGTKFVPKDFRMLSPLDHLQKCKGIIYSLQLSLYAFIMELWGYKLIDKGLMIFHIRPRRRPKLININYYKEDVRKMLEHHSNSLLKQQTEKTISRFGIT